MKNHGQSTNKRTVALANAQILHSLANPALGEDLATTFRIYTEDTLQPFAPFLQRFGFDGATIYSATGVWQGTTERSAVLEIIAPYARRVDVVRMAAAIAAEHNQTAVLLTWANARTHETITVDGGK